MALPHQGWSIERDSGNRNAPWRIVHKGTWLPVPVLRPYPGADDLPPIEVCNFRSRQEAEAAAQEIDWAAVEEIAERAETIEAGRRYREKRAFDETYQQALDEARAGREPWPWEAGGLLHRNVVELETPAPMTLFDLEEAA